MPTTFGALTPSYFRFRSGDFLRLRDATRSDVSQMRQLEQESSTAAHWSESHYDSLFDSAAKRIVRIAEDDFVADRIHGFVIARCLPDEWEIENILVAPASQRRGVGFSLLEDCVRSARAAGAERVLLEVRESNGPARRLYEKIGFTLVGRRKDYYRNPLEDAILYRFSLHFYDKIC